MREPRALAAERWWQQVRLRDIALGTVVVLLVVLGFVLLLAVQDVLVGIFLGLLLAIGLRPVVERLQWARLPRQIAASLALGLLLGGVAAVGALVIPMAINQVRALVAILPELLEGLRDELISSRLALVRQIGRQLPSSLQRADGAVGETPLAAMAWLASWLPNLERTLLFTVSTLLFAYYWLLYRDRSLAGLLLSLATRLGVGVVLVLSATFLGFYWLLEQPQIERAGLALLPLNVRSRVRSVWMRIYREVGIYVRGGAALSLLTFCLLLIMYVLLGMPGATLMALFGGLAMVVPVLGAPIALLPTLAVMAVRGPAEGLLALSAGAVMIGLIKLAVAPQLFRHGLTVNPVLAIVCIMILGDLGGILLILFGPPLAAAIQTAVQALRIEPAFAPPQLQGEQAIQLLHQRLDAISSAALPDEPQVGSLVSRARAIVSAASDLLAHNMLR